MTTTDHIRDYRRAMAAIKAPAKPQAPKRVPVHVKPGQSTRRQRILETAARLYQPGQNASPKAIADQLGITRQTVSGVIAYLKRQGEWPYGSIGTGQWRKRR